MAAVLVLRLVFITMAVTSSLGFVLRRRDWDDDADGDLAEALPVLRAERQRLDDEGPSLGGATSYWAEAEMPRAEEEEGLELDPRLSVGDDRALLDSLLSEDSDEGYYGEIPGDGYEEEGSPGDMLSRLDSDSAGDITESPADLRELETILEPSDDEKAEEEEEEIEKEEEEEYAKDKENRRIALGGPDRSKRGFRKSKQKEEEEAEQNGLDALLKTAEQLEQDALLSTTRPEVDDDEVDDDDESASITPIPVSDAELRAVLGDEEEEEETQEEGPEVADEEEEKGEEILPPLSYAPAVPIKIKRSSRNFLQEPDDEEEEAVEDGVAVSAAEGRAAREYIRRFLELEDDENTNLANALNLATMAQVHQRSDKLVVPEAKFIRKAIEDEQAIQELRAALSRDDPLPPPAGVSAAAQAIGKREMEFDARELNDLDEDDQEEEEDFEDEEQDPGEMGFNPYSPEDDEEEEENLIQEVGYGPDQNDLALKLREYLEHAGALQRQNEVEEDGLADPLQRGAWLDRPIEMGQEGLTEQVRPATKDKPSARCLPFQHFALQTYLRSKSYRRQWGLKRCKSTRTVKARIDPRVSYPRIKDFEARYRLPPSCVEELTDEFEESAFRPGKGKHETRGSPIPLFHKVCYALRFLATGSYYTVIRDTQGGVSRSSVGRAVTAFVKFLVSRYKRHVSFPKEEALHLAAVNFAQRHKVNKCIGCIDGTYVPLMRPTRNEHVYVCRKGYHALNVMVVSDYEEKILYVESGMSGCHHDQSVLAYSDLGHHMAYRPERFGGYFLLGDGGYKLTPQVLTPFRCKMLSELEPHQQRYQVAHVTARSSVERCIGQLKSRWRVLSKSGVGALHMQPLQASWVVKACCVLHNRCVDWGLRKLRPGDNRDPEMEMRIRVEARARFLRANRHLQPEDVPAGDGLHPDNYGPGHAGVRYRQRYIYNQYGGPAPVDIGRGTRRQRGTGARGRGRGRGGARGRGRGQGQAGRPR